MLKIVQKSRKLPVFGKILTYLQNWFLLSNLISQCLHTQIISTIIFIKFLLLDKKWQGLQYCHFHPYQHKILYGPKWSSMVRLFPVWSGMVPYCPILSSMILYCPLWSIIILYGPAWFSLGYIYGRFFPVTNFCCCKMCFCWFCNRQHYSSCNNKNARHSIKA